MVSPVRRKAQAVSTLIVALLLGLAPAYAEVLHRGNRYEPATLDPQKYNTAYEAKVIADLFEGLTAFDAAGTPQPAVAAAWTVSADGKTWTFTLRPNLHWSDGTALTAADIVNSFHRLFSPKTAATFAPLLSMIRNARAVMTGALPMESLGVAAQGANLVVTLDAPAPYLPQLLAEPFASILPHAAIDRWGDAWIKPEHAVFNGAFVLKEWWPQNHIVLARNPRYRDAANVALDEVIYEPTADLEAAEARFRAGELDIQRDFPPADIPLLRTELPAALHVAPALVTYYLALNTALPKLADARTRRALSLAIDRNLLTSKVMRGGEGAAYGLVPPAVAGSLPLSADDFDRAPDQRLAEARALLAAAGYDERHPLRLTFSHSAVIELKRVAVAIAAMWARIGVQTSLAPTEGKVLFANLRGGDYEVGLAAWTADFNDPAAFLYILQSGSTASNYSRYHSAAFDASMAQAAATADVVQRATLLHRAEVQALADQPIIPLAFGTSMTLVRPEVHGWIDNPMDMHPSRALSIDRASGATR